MATCPSLSSSPGTRCLRREQDERVTGWSQRVSIVSLPRLLPEFWGLGPEAHCAEEQVEAQCRDGGCPGPPDLTARLLSFSPSTEIGRPRAAPHAPGWGQRVKARLGPNQLSLTDKAALGLHSVSMLGGGGRDGAFLRLQRHTSTWALCHSRRRHSTHRAWRRSGTPRRPRDLGRAVAPALFLKLGISPNSGLPTGGVWGWRLRTKDPPPV